MVDKISTNPLQNIDNLLAGGVASSKCNLKNSKGLGCFPTSQMAKRTQGIYLCTACQFAKPVQVCIACYFCDSITVPCLGFKEKRDSGWIVEGIGVIFSGWKILIDERRKSELMKWDFEPSCLMLIF